ncbi:hypothetical protein CMUS01_13745 [Colletotrichum musicola]|uniref:AAA+ ATPase domain-containing protein n=1 Tax=Colletotrichum musicola TaxID=2175873 RepID=A0A8H6J9T0_9PEZI|nr:hypothetical protein CMUS01_13745 [Colletotrichum musicola]
MVSGSDEGAEGLETAVRTGAAVDAASTPPVPSTHVEANDVSASQPSSPKVNESDEQSRRDKETQAVPEPLRDEELRDIGAAEVRSFNERFRAMESKMNLVDTMYGLHESTEQAMKDSRDPIPEFQIYWKEEGQRFNEHYRFYKDAMFFMSRIRDSHQRLHHYDMLRRQRAEEARKANSGYSIDLETTQISTKAFVNGEPAKLMQVDWDVFVRQKRDVEKSILTPIEVISGEPDSQIILQLAATKKLESSALRRTERIAPTGEDGQPSSMLPLPERIRIHSVPLVSAFYRILRSRGANRTPWALPKNGSVVILRPYQELVYYANELREHLANLERRFENYDGTGTIPRVSTRTQDGEKTDNSHALSSAEVRPVSASGPSSHEKRETENGGDDDDTDANSDDDASRVDGDMKGTAPCHPSMSITALLHLRCLMGFVDTEIKPKQEYIRSSNCTRIHFHDLWHLFKPGDEVIEQNEKQVYVVLRVQIPPHKVEEPWERWNRRVVDDSDSSEDEDAGEGDDRPFTLHCAYIDFDGKTFGPVSRKFKISPFGELKAIRSLPVYPFRYAKEVQTRQDFIKRGRMLLDVANFKSMYYMGVTLDKRDEIDSQVVIDFNEALADEDRRKAWEPMIAPVNTAPDKSHDDDGCMALCCQGQIVHDGSLVDTNMTEDYIRKLIPDSSLGAPSLILSPRSLEDTLGSMNQLTETELLIMTYRVFGFVLRSRKWAQLDLTLLRYENANARNLTVNAFERLELPEGHREMVKSLVVQHFRSRQSAKMRDEQTDLIQGKGKGLIMLLHGAPGVGKTTTAEGIAELFRKPLFQITCGKSQLINVKTLSLASSAQKLIKPSKFVGDLGTTAKEVEAELEKNFALASRWGCILLLDEADVFLSARERMDFVRNGLVAVFLRVLEYYAGILFLTTNRIGDFDEAFASRIHMSLYYPELDELKTLKVFKLNLDLIQQRFEKQGRRINFDASSIEDFAQQHFQQYKYNRWNGRQIRNACQTALALAEFDAQGGALDIDGEVDKAAVVQLQLKYFKTVQKSYLDFGKYLGDIQGTHGDRRAIDYKLRARTDTPYQASRPSLFSQPRDEPRPQQHQHLHPHLHAHRTSSDMSQSNYGSQADPFYQGGYSAAASSSAGMSQQPGYGQYPTQPNQPQAYQGQAGPGFIGNSGSYESPSSFGHSTANRSAQMNPRFSQGGQQGQHFESSQPGFQTMHGEETPQRQGMSHNDGSPLPHRPVPHQQAQYGYGNLNQGDGLQNPGAPMQDTSTPPSNVPRSLFRQEGLISQGNSSSLGDNMPPM